MKWGLWLILVNSWSLCLSQTSIGVIDFDGSSNYIGHTISGTTTASDSTNSSYTGGSVGLSGDGLEVKGASVTLTSVAINTSSYSNISLKIRLASLSTSASNGNDVTDYVTLSISNDNGTSWSEELKVTGWNNGRWSYSGVSGVASTTYDNNNSAITYSPTSGGGTADGFSTILINSLPSVSNLKFKIDIFNNDVSEIWAIDAIELVGYAGCSTASSVSSASTALRSFELDASWTNSSCYDEVVVFMNETSGIQVTPSGSYGSYTGNSVYSAANQCVYNGVGNSVTVTGLKNGTTYYFEIFTRRNSNWSSGVEVSGTPDFDGLTVSALNTPVTIDFDNSLNGVNNSAFNGSGFASSPSTGQINSNSWSATGFSDGDCDFEDTKTTGDFARGTSSGGVGTGGIYSFEVASSDYALGVQPIGVDFTPGEFIFRTANETGNTVTSILLQYDVYINNNQNRSNAINFSYSTDGQGYTSINELRLMSIESGGSAGWIKSTRVGYISSISIPDNSFFYLKWTGDDFGGANDRDEFALDNIKLSLHTSVPSSPSISSTVSLETLKVNAIDFTLGSDLQVDSIELNNSILSIGNYDLTIVEDAFSGSSTEFIETNGTGEVIKEFSATGSFTYPVGKVEYSPITLNFTSGSFSSANASVRVNDNVYSAVSASATTSDYISRYWSVSQSGISSFTCNVNAIYDDGDIVGTEGNLFMGKWDGSTITVGNNVNSTDNELSINGITSFSDFTGAGSPLLPVSWLYFKGERKGNMNVLNWATASELNNSHFDIEKSVNGIDFVNLGRVAGAGNSNEIKEYSYTDRYADPINYYRLKQVDFDGEFEYSKALKVLRAEEVVDFNLIGAKLAVSSVSELQSRVLVISSDGKVLEDSLFEGTILLTTEKYRKGIYFVTVFADGKAFNYRLIK